MSFVTAAVIGGGVALAGSLLGANAAQGAASAQSDAARRSTDAQLQMFNTINSQQAPYRQSGYNALSALNMGMGFGPTPNYDSSGSVSAPPSAPTREQFTKPAPSLFNNSGVNPFPNAIQGPANNAMAGGSTFDQAGFDAATKAFQAQATNMPQTGSMPIGGGAGALGGVAGQLAGVHPTGPTSGPTGGIAPGYFTHQFDANDLKTNLAPNYQFQLDQGLGALKNAGNLQTGLISGNTLKGIEDYAQNYAGGAYQNAFNNYTANQSNIFNRLSNIAGLGQTANANTGNAGTTLAGNAGNSIMAGGAAQAAGQVGVANAITGGANNALGWYTLSQIMNKGGGVNV